MVHHSSSWCHGKNVFNEKCCILKEIQHLAHSQKLIRLSKETMFYVYSFCMFLFPIMPCNVDSNGNF